MLVGFRFGAPFRVRQFWTCDKVIGNGSGRFQRRCPITYAGEYRPMPRRTFRNGPMSILSRSNVDIVSNWCRARLEVMPASDRLCQRRVYNSVLERNDVVPAESRQGDARMHTHTNMTCTTHHMRRTSKCSAIGRMPTSPFYMLTWPLLPASPPALLQELPPTHFALDPPDKGSATV